MKSMCWLLIFALFLYAGCSATRMVTYSPESYEEINKRLKGRKATVTLVQGNKYHVSNMTIRTDSTSWLGLDNFLPFSVPTIELEKLEIDRSRIGYGIALAAVLAGGLGGIWAASKIMTDKDRTVVAPFVAIGIGGLCLGLGILLSLPVIFFTMGKDEYVFEQRGAQFLYNRYPSQIIIFSHTVGESIDQEEYHRFRLETTFLKTEGFQSAVLFRLYDGNEYLRITFLGKDSAVQQEKWIPVGGDLKKQIIEYFEEFDTEIGQ